MMTPETQSQPSLEDFALLAEVSKMLTVLDQDRVMERVIELLSRRLGAERSTLFLHAHYELDWQRIFIKELFDTSGEWISGTEPMQLVSMMMRDGLAGWVVGNRQGTIVEDTATDPRWLTYPGQPYQVGSALCVPFIANGDVMAVLTLSHSQPHHFTPYHLQLVTIIVNQATIVVRNAQLFRRMLQQQRQLEAVLHAMPDLLLVLDEQRRILLANDEAVRLLNTASDTVIGQPLRAFINIDTVIDRIVEITSTPLQSGQMWAF
ncbi:MAG: GAF domain-containing protein [Blastochloris sp.]|nr:GAF domain-containing protein [Blastochloris sp.]